MNIQERIAEAMLLPYRLELDYLGEVLDGVQECQVNELVHGFGGDCAVELRYNSLRLYWVTVHQVDPHDRVFMSGVKALLQKVN